MVAHLALKVAVRAFFAATIIVCCARCTNPLFVDSQDITQGEVGGFHIGMDKQQVLQLALAQHVHAIQPILGASNSFNYSNADLLVFPKEERSLELDNGRALKVVYTVSHCKVANVRSLGTMEASIETRVGDPSQSLVDNLKNMLEGDHALWVREVVSSENGSWFVIDHLRPNEVNYMDGYDIWSFEVTSVKPAGAQFVLYFSEGAVVRISYKRPRIHLE
jgi:hypothetical protein